MRKYHIRSVLLRYFLLTALLPVIVLSALLCMTHYYSNIRKVTRENMEMLSAAAWTVEERLAMVELLPMELSAVNGQSSKFSRDSLWMLLADMREGAKYPVEPENFPHYVRIRNIMDHTYCVKYQYITGYYFLARNGKMLKFGMPDSLKPEVDMAYMEENFGEKAPGYVYKGCGDIYTLSASNAQDNVMTYVAGIEGMSGQEPLAILLIQINDKLFETLSDTLLRSGTDHYYVLSGNGTVFQSDSRKAAEGEAHPELSQYLNRSAAEYDWRTQTVICSYALDDFTMIYTSEVKTWQLMGNSFLITGCVAVFAGIYAVLMAVYSTRKFSAPIIRLQKAMEEDGNLQVPGDKSEAIYEFHVLNEKYNELLRTINQYIRDKYEQELLIVRTRMKVLEAQIDKHFLYNTLECIQSMAMLRGADDAARVVKALADMFRYTSQVQEATVRVQDELEYVQDYIFIQRARFGEKVNCIVKVEPKYLGRRILKMSLQPLVENSFKHGFKKTRRMYHIYITCVEVEGKLQLRVSDNGVGMDFERLSVVRNRFCAEEESSGGIGLGNVEKRMKLYFGGDAKVWIESIPGEGTVVTLEFPSQAWSHGEEFT